MTEERTPSPLDRIAGLVPVDALIRQVDVNELSFASTSSGWLNGSTWKASSPSP